MDGPHLRHGQDSPLKVADCDVGDLGKHPIEICELLLIGVMHGTNHRRVDKSRAAACESAVDVDDSAAISGLPNRPGSVTQSFERALYSALKGPLPLLVEPARRSFNLQLAHGVNRHSDTME